MDTILAYDLGTGGNKASLYTADGRLIASEFMPYATEYPQAGWHEQRPLDWWASVVESTRRLLAHDEADPNTVRAIAISGHSLGCVPLDAQGNLLREATPIWSDSRPKEQAEAFFKNMDLNAWYRATGNGFPAPHYTAFKIAWYKDNEPEMFDRIDTLIGTKDYINYRLTGRIATDYSYASGLGAYNLLDWAYDDALLAAAGLARDLLPEITPSTEILGTLTADAASELGLPQSVQVACGGVDNSCMSLGARCFQEGQMYASLGSSIWIANSSRTPMIEDASKPYVFTHVVPEMFVSALAIFSGGTSLRWVRDHLCKDLVSKAESEGRDPYDLMTELAATSPVGANKLLFNPSLAGGTSLDASPAIRGAFLGLDLGHTQADVIRATLEGIGLNLRIVLDELRRIGHVGDEMVVVGGGSNSPMWCQILADTMQVNIVKTNVGQEAGSLGAAAVAAVGIGLWDDFAPVDAIHEVESVTKPNDDNAATYDQLLPVFKQACIDQAKLGDALAGLRI